MLYYFLLSGLLITKWILLMYKKTLATMRSGGFWWKKGSNWGEGWRWSVKNCVSQSSMTNEQWLSALFSLQHMFFLLSQKLSSLFFNLSRTHTLTPPSTLCICLLLYTPGYHFYLSFLFIYLFGFGIFGHLSYQKNKRHF